MRKKHGAKENPASMSIFLVRTEGEWEKMEERLLSMGKKDLSSLIHSEAHKLISLYRECPACLTPASGRKVARQPWISVIVLKELEPIAEAMQKPIGAVIQDFIIAPLLQRGKA